MLICRAMRCRWSVVAVCALLGGAPAPVEAGQEAPTAGATLRPLVNPVYPSGRLVIEYSLDRPAERVDIDILDAKGAAVAGWSGGAAGSKTVGQADRFTLAEALTRQGRNTVTWDLRASGYFAAGAPGSPPRFSPGPLVPPGTYTAQLTALGQTLQQTFTVVARPPLAAGRQADLEAQFDFLMQVRGRASAASAAITRVRAMKDRVAARLKTIEDPAMTEAGASLLKQLTALEGGGGEPVSATSGVVTLHEALIALRGAADAVGRPTDALQARLQELGLALQSRIISLNALSAGAYARFERGEAPLQGSTGAEFSAATVQFDRKGIDFGAWLRTFTARVKANWSIPSSARSERGHVVVQFVVHRSGEITDVVVAAASEVAAFNASAERAVLAAAFAPPLPDKYPADTCPVTMTFYFNEAPPQKRRP
jgi:TonB family protein